jgi:membrane-associated phospholipid phosphatase
VSRVVSGLHDTSDVLAATGSGCALAGLSLCLVPGTNLFG